MDLRLGYVGHSFVLGIGANHTCRVANATADRLEWLIAENLAELEQLLLFNEAHGIHVYRISSQLIPLASHPVNQTRWWRTFARDFEHLGRIATRSGQRLSLHPSPAGASLSSARAEVRAATLSELVYSTRVLDLLGQDPHGRIVIHVGGAAPDRLTALDTAHRFLEAMPEDARRRLVIEHDDRMWNAREVLPLALDHGLPLLADSLHNALLPSDPPLSTRALLRLASASWHALGLRPKHHIASQREGGKPGAHAESISTADWRAFEEAAEHPADVMIEAKDKDLSLFALRRLGAEQGAPELEAPPT